MIFNELYSAYYNTVAAIIGRLIEGDCDERELHRVVEDMAFGESALTILPALKSGRWQLARPDLTTPITHKPTLPLTALQKRWLKAISLDPRMKLFGVTLTGLEDVEPLFTPDDYRIYDRYADGDPYGDEAYIQKFRTILRAIRGDAPVKMEIKNRKGNTVFFRCRPVKLEYSEKDDKFRVAVAGSRFITTVNLGRILTCAPYTGDKAVGRSIRPRQYETLTLRITDERNCLERCMFHFAHFEKQAERLDRRHYLLRLKYDRDDEPELVIRILSFGPRVEVISPDAFRELLREKLRRQMECGLR